MFVLRKKKEFVSPQRPRGIRVRGQLANGTARAGLKRAPTDINTGFGDGARPNPIYGSNNMMDTTSANIGTTTMNIEQFHSPTNDNDELTVWNEDDVAPHLDDFLEEFGTVITSFQEDRTQ